MRWLDSIINSMDKNLHKLTEIVEDRGNWYAIVYMIAKSWTLVTEQQQPSESSH